MLNYKLFAVLAFIVTSGIVFEDAFADHTAVQPNAYASYDTTTNQVQVEWDFTSSTGGVAPETCVLKGDVYYIETVNERTNKENFLNYNTVSSFIPIHYSTVSATPVIVTNGQSAEIIPCAGTMRIDIATMMSHSTNIDNHPDLQIFLSFYSLHENRGFTFDIIDEVFVIYTPVHTFTTVAPTNPASNESPLSTTMYACGGQIGSTLYIDQTGIHGDNGDNCGDYLSIVDNQWVDISMNPNSGTVSNGDHVAGTYQLLTLVDYSTPTTSGGSDDNRSRPTFGIDYKTFNQLVTNGLIINDHAFNVTDNYWTPIPMQNMTVGATQNFTAKVFAPHSLNTLEFLFGVPEVDKWNDREASIEIYTNYNGEALDFKINESDKDQPLINKTSLKFSVSKEQCNPQDNTEPCFQVSAAFSFLQAPIGKVLAIQAIDNDRKNIILYFNDGIDVTGDSLNPPTVQQIRSEIKYKGLQTVQLIDKEKNIWMSMDKSEPVFLYQQNDFETFIPIVYRTFESTPDEARTNMDRLHSEFSKLIEYEKARAVEKFDSKLIKSELAPSWNYVYPVKAVDDSKRLQELKDEAERAQALLVELLSKTHYANMVSNDSKVGILNEFVSDRTLGDILAEERATKLIEAKERSYLKQVLSTKN